MRIIAIAAVARNGVIGRENALPWSIPEDMRFFRSSTRGQIVVMGRKTYESLGKALPARENAVISRNPGWSAPDARVFRGLQDAIRFFRESPSNAGKNLFVIGGAEIYRLALPDLDEVWLTEIDAEFPGDTRFYGYENGRLDLKGFVLDRVGAQQEAHPAGLAYRFAFYKRKTE
jgi:dihydrofolate reductase